MKNKKVILLSVSLLFISLSSYAQYGTSNPNNIAEMKARKTLLVVLQPEDPDLIQELSKKGHAGLIDTYKKKVKEYNDNLQAAFANWPYQKDVEFESLNKVASLLSNRANEYTVIAVWMDIVKEGGTVTKSFVTPYLVWDSKEITAGDYDFQTREFGTKYINMDLTLGEEFIKIFDKNLHFTNVTSAPIISHYPSVADLITGIYSIKHYNDCIEGGNKSSEVIKDEKKISTKLKDETLIIRKADLGKDLNSTTIGAIYQYKFKIVADSTMDKIVRDKTPGMACMINIPGSEDLHYQQIFDFETGEVLGEVALTKASMIGNPSVLVAQKGLISEKVFKKLMEQMDGK